MGTSLYVPEILHEIRNSFFRRICLSITLTFGHGGELYRHPTYLNACSSHTKDRKHSGVEKLKTCNVMTARAWYRNFEVQTCVHPWVESIHEGTGANLRVDLAGRRDYQVLLAARYISISMLIYTSILT